jgi:Icc-related predicted phosphoesterase
MSIKLLLFSDLHCDAAAASRLVQRSQGFDVAVCAGDLANCRRQLSVCVDVLKGMTCPVVMAPGNNESFDELTKACRGWTSAHVLHGSGIRICGIEFFGVGGGIPVTPFGDWSFDFTEDQAESLLASCPTDGVLVSHSPPKGLLDIASNGRSLGSTAVRAAMERVTPRLVVCGHIHASAGQSTKFGDTTIINAGPQGMEFEFAI